MKKNEKPIKLKIYKNDHGNTLVAQVLDGGKLSTRVFDLELMYQFCCNFMEKNESFDKLGPVLDRMEKRISSTEELYKTLANSCDQLFLLTKREPRLGWKK